MWALINASIVFQSTHPRGVRLANNYYYRTSSDASIHAPAWGATFYRILGMEDDEVSIHAPAWGATCFFFVCDYGRLVSIHAPAWGATLIIIYTSLLLCKFQFTHPRGV